MNIVQFPTVDYKYAFRYRLDNVDKTMSENESKIIEGLQAIKFILIDQGADESRVNSITTMKDAQMYLQYIEKKNAAAKQEKEKPEPEEPETPPLKLAENAGTPPSKAGGADPDNAPRETYAWDPARRENYDNLYTLEGAILLSHPVRARNNKIKWVLP